MPYVKQRRFKNLQARDPRSHFHRGAQENNLNFERHVSQMSRQAAAKSQNSQNLVELIDTWTEDLELALGPSNPIEMRVETE